MNRQTYGWMKDQLDGELKDKQIHQSKHLHYPFIHLSVHPEGDVIDDMNLIQ